MEEMVSVMADPNADLSTMGSIQTQNGVDGVTVQAKANPDSLPDVPEKFFSVKPGEHMDVDAWTGDARWYWAKDVPGDGDRPDWLPDGTTVEDMAKRAEGLRKQISSIKHAPPEYSINIDPEIGEVMGITPDDPLIQEFKNIALGADISQEGFNEILNMYMEHQAGIILNQMDENKAQLEAWGIDGDEAFTQIENWAKNNLPLEDAQILSEMTMSAPQMRVVQSMIKKFCGDTNIAGSVSDSYLSREQQLEEVQKLMRGGVGSLERINKLYGIG